MTDEESNKELVSSNLEIMDYLIEKLNSRYSKIIKYNKIFCSLDSLENFNLIIDELKVFFIELEQDLRQGIFAIKALVIQNKKILNELNIKNEENRRITEQLNNFFIENKKLKSEIIKFKENNINSLIDENITTNLQIKDNNFNINNKINRSKSKGSLQKRREKAKENDIDEYKKNNYEFEQLSNVKNIMDTMKKNKMKLKTAIEKHFINKGNESNYE